jgi:hypothetical protein
MATEIQTTPAVINYIHKKGDDWTPDTITVYDGGTIVDGVVVGGTVRNFTGYTGRLQIRTILSNDVIITLTNGAGITLSSLGVITLTMTAAQTAAIAAGDYKFDMQTTSGAGVIKTWIEGSFTIVTDVTANS